MPAYSTRTAGQVSSWATRPRCSLPSGEPGPSASPEAPPWHTPPSWQPPAKQSSLTPPAPLPATPAPANAITRIHASKLTALLFKRHQRDGTPLLIEGCVRPPCTDRGRWALRAFAAAVGTTEPLTCRIHGNDGFATSPERWHGRSHMRSSVSTNASMFADSIESGLAAGGDCYVQHDLSRTQAGTGLAPTFDALGKASGLRIHPLYGPLVNMWWGPPGHTEPLHMDVTDGTLLQLHGQKQVVLFPPECWPALRPHPVDPAGMSWAFSRLNLRRALAADPASLELPLREALARRVELTLCESEMLFIPACAAHEISGLAAAAEVASGDPHHVLSVNRFWETDAARVVPNLPEDARRAFIAEQKQQATS